MLVFDKIKDMQKYSGSLRADGISLGFVPTMGALHGAHASLIKRSVKENDFTVVSIFVNPTQFGPDEDFNSYPRKFEKDSAVCEELGVSAIFHPSSEEMYAVGSVTTVNVEKLSETMCGAHRPGHFRGVATVVAKLFNIVNPSRVYLGQKDYQQFRVIERMVKDLNFNLELIMCPTVREEDGLAMSSRNKYLNDEERKKAPGIYQALVKGKELIESGEKDAKKVSGQISSCISETLGDVKIDYAGVYDAFDLNEVERIEKPVVLAAAVKLGKARLIDNVIAGLEEKRNK